MSVSGRETGPMLLPTQADVMSQAGDENFPVALWLLGPRMRRDLLAVYGFARLVDDIGDETPGDRMAMLAQIEHELDFPHHPVMVALERTVRTRRLPREPFLRLIEANRQDQRVHVYKTTDALWEYCMLSAAPVGQIVLDLFGCATPERIALSDQVCAALQVIEHLQDVEEDAARGRRYIGPFDAHAYAHELLRAGPPLVRGLTGRAKIAVAGFVAGGRTALARLEHGERSFGFELSRAVAGR